MDICGPCADGAGGTMPALGASAGSVDICGPPRDGAGGTILALISEVVP